MSKPVNRAFYKIGQLANFFIFISCIISLVNHDIILRKGGQHDFNLQMA